MTVTEKVAYLKGLADGLSLDKETKEGKLISVIIDTLEDIALEIEDLSESTVSIGDEIDAITEDLADVESVLFGIDDEDDDDESCCCGSDEDDDCCCSDDDPCCCGEDDEYAYEVTCPSCGEDIIIEESDLERGEVVCPKCSEKLEFEFDEDDEDSEDDK